MYEMWMMQVYFANWNLEIFGYQEIGKDYKW
jgi:hypothetical protein